MNETGKRAWRNLQDVISVDRTGEFSCWQNRSCQSFAKMKNALLWKATRSLSFKSGFGRNLSPFVHNHKVREASWSTLLWVLCCDMFVWPPLCKTTLTLVSSSSSPSSWRREYTIGISVVKSSSSRLCQRFRVNSRSVSLSSLSNDLDLALFVKVRVPSKSFSSSITDVLPALLPVWVSFPREL